MIEIVVLLLCLFYGYVVGVLMVLYFGRFFGILFVNLFLMVEWDGNFFGSCVVGRGVCKFIVVNWLV